MNDSLQPVMVVENISHRYTNNIGITDISLELRPGEILGLLGPMVLVKPPY